MDRANGQSLAESPPKSFYGAFNVRVSAALRPNTLPLVPQQ